VTRFVATACIVFLCLIWGCQCREQSASVASGWQFTLLDSTQTGIGFRNDVPYTDSFNCYLFRNFYNGGGVGLGDINNDGLLDVFLCGNMSPNRLYLNLGNWRFKDITEACGMGLSKTWTAGVAFADVNGDGWLDIYTCKSGPPGGPDRHNELYINTLRSYNDTPAFVEQSHKYGLDNTGLSTHAAFFDYDHDGDLDCYLLNNSLRSVGGYDFRPGQREVPDLEGGNQLLRQDNGRFTDVSRQAGIYSSAIGFGLGVTIGDYDRDGWQDIFVSNDFFERDYLYHNQHDGTFSEVLDVEMPEISKGSMGADMADLNNDGFPELFVTEMTPPDDRRYKTKATFDDWNTYATMQRTGYHRQFGRNVLQLNTPRTSQQPATGGFSEVGRMAGVAYTDWSWGALLADFDNDGYKDIFVANGIGKDLLDQDYVNFYSNPMAIREMLQKNPGQGIRTLIDQMPSQPLSNYLFRQQAAPAGSIPQFESVASAIGLGTPSYSNGSAYGDLDNDGDLDLVVNNVNMPCFVYRNELPASRPWLKVQVIGNALNTNGLGALVSVTSGGITQYQEIAPMRGFESCVDPRPNFGLLGDTATRVEVRFPSGHTAVLTNVLSHQTILVHEHDAQPLPDVEISAPGVMLHFNVQNLPDASRPVMGRAYSDFDREPLLFRMFSTDGYHLATADINRDGLDDVYRCGTGTAAGELLMQQPDGTLKRSQQPDFQRFSDTNESDATFFDANGDGHLDLYVGAGSNADEPAAPALQDRLYLNDGRGTFRNAPDALPPGKPFATACVRPHDVDGDGDTDLFVGMRLLPGHYGQAPQSFVLLNDGQARFAPAPPAQYPALQQLGMVTDAAWADLDQDGSIDLVVSADWEPLRVIYGAGGAALSPQPTVIAPSGWWNCLTLHDLDLDGDLDLVAGNFGYNTRFRASESFPMTLFWGDFDQNSRDETLLCQYEGDKLYPLNLRNDVVRQMPIFKKRYLHYHQYANQTAEQVLGPDALQRAQKKTAATLATSVVLNHGKRQWAAVPLPAPAQISPVYAIAVTDVTGDGLPDLLLGGNHEQCKPEVGIHLASGGVVLAGSGQGYFNGSALQQMGLEGAVRDFVLLRSQRGSRVVAARVERPLSVVDWGVSN
jgi:enediyne biosynthesis protein E4